MIAFWEETLSPIVVNMNNYLSSYILIFLLVGVGLWYSIKTRFVQIRYFGAGMKKVFGNLSLRGGKQESGMSSFQALALFALTRMVVKSLKEADETAKAKP